MVATTNATTEYLYECMFLVDSARYASDHEGVLNELTAMLEKVGGSVEVARPWQDGRLAYEIEGHRKGTHILFLLKMPGSGVNDLNRSVRLSDLVIRHLVIRHSETLYTAMTSALSPDAEIQRSAYDDDAPRKPRDDSANADDDSDIDDEDGDDDSDD